MSVVYLPLRTAQCTSCGIHFRPRHRTHRWCWTCYRWLRAYVATTQAAALQFMQAAKR